MQKIISLFKRDYEGNRQVIDEVVPGAEWVQAGEGVSTVKMDGTCCLVREGKLYKRHTVKRGKVPPLRFIPATEVDPITGKRQGWLPVGSGPEDLWHNEALRNAGPVPRDGTYELVGPKVQGNPDTFIVHQLIEHGNQPCYAPRTFNELKVWFVDVGWDIEGVVWHHPDGRMVKIKGIDFGIKRGKA